MFRLYLLFSPNLLIYRAFRFINFLPRSTLPFCVSFFTHLLFLLPLNSLFFLPCLISLPSSLPLLKYRDFHFFHFLPFSTNPAVNLLPFSSPYVSPTLFLLISQVSLPLRSSPQFFFSTFIFYEVQHYPSVFSFSPFFFFPSCTSILQPCFTLLLYSPPFHVFPPITSLSSIFLQPFHFLRSSTLSLCILHLFPPLTSTQPCFTPFLSSLSPPIALPSSPLLLLQRSIAAFKARLRGLLRWPWLWRPSQPASVGEYDHPAAPSPSPPPNPTPPPMPVRPSLPSPPPTHTYPDAPRS